MDATRTRVKVADISNVYRRREGKRRVSGVTVVPALGQPRERTVTVLAGIGNSAPFSCHNADLLALEKAVVERIMCVKRPKAPEEERVLSVNDVWDGSHCLRRLIRVSFVVPLVTTSTNSRVN